MSTAHPPILIVGGNGMLARAFRELLESRSVPFRAVDLPDFDITDLGSVHSAVTDRTTMVLNCAAWTDVDGAEANEPGALAVNGTGVANLAAACRRAGALLVHFSTDYVFDGASSRPYPTDQRRGPIGAYGRTKAVGEEAIERESALGLEALVIRTSWLYAPWAKNFVRTIAAAAKARPQLRVVNDQRGRPTSSEHLARATLELTARNARGVFHVTDGGECTWFDFATEIVRLAGLSGTCRVDPCTTLEFPRPARRPAYSVLDLSKTEALIGPRTHWKETLADVMRRLEP